MQSSPYVRPLSALSSADIGLVGGKNASLGELTQALTPLGIRVPGGFAVTVRAYRDALEAAGAWPRLHELLGAVDKKDMAGLSRAALAARELVYAAGLPKLAEEEIRAAYRAFLAENGADASVAVRSSATAEDLPGASFAGQHDSYLNVKGEEQLLDAIRRCQASIFTDRAISYRIDQKFDHFKVGVSVAVQKMVRSDLSSSGVMFSVDTESGHPDFVFITSAWGLGENVVQGAVDPDEFYVHKPTLARGFPSLVKKRVGRKQMTMVYASAGTREAVTNRATAPEDQKRFSLGTDDVIELARAAVLIEEHYSKLAGERRPMDMEWAKDGPNGQLYIVQARPETSTRRATDNQIQDYVLDGHPKVLVTGRAVGAKIGVGQVKVTRHARELAAFRPGDVLVADTTAPDWEPIMKTAAAIVTSRGGRTCHAAIVARELGIPAVVGAENATEILKDGMTVTVACAHGAEGEVLEGAAPFHIETTDVSIVERPQTRVMMNLGNPDLALELSQLPADGVGLARMEFIITEYIGVHPLAALYPERVVDSVERAQVLARFEGYPDGRAYFVDRLGEGVATIAAAFYPRPVIIRLSDFKSNEYASLAGGRGFEPIEENPMIGFRGASRYIHPAYAEGFALECEALLRVRDTLGLTNLEIMVPFCRRIDEAERVISSMAAHGLVRGQNGLKVHVMCEIPNNVLLIDEFSKHFDGFSIGSNDLTQLTLGVDRDSALVSDRFDERDPGVLKILKMAVEGAQRNHRHVGICGQAPSDHPEIARFLVELGIDSLSLTPDRIQKTLVLVREVERSLGRAPR